MTTDSRRAHGGAAGSGHRVVVSMVPADGTSDGRTVAELAAMINDVYATAESGLWIPGAARTTQEEVADLIGAEQIAVARRGGRLVGAVRIRELGDGLGEFGMLVVAPSVRGAGVGRRLVEFAEERMRARGDTRSQLELLVPRSWTHPVKEFLRRWYTRMGYRQVRHGDFDADHPALVPMLATPCDYLVFRKDLPQDGAVDRAPAVRIRRADLATDAPVVGDLMVEYLTWALGVLRSTYDVDSVPTDVSQVRSTLGEFEGPSRVLLVAEDASGQVVGVAALRPLEPGVVEFKRMYVRPDRRGQGVGALLLDALLDEARGLGAATVRLDTVRFMHDAQRLYRSRGFEERPPYEGTEIPGSLQQHWLFFERSL